MPVLSKLTLLAGSTLMAFAMGPGVQPDRVVGTILYLDGQLSGPLKSADQTQVVGSVNEVLGFLPGSMSAPFYNTWIVPFLSGQRPLKTLRIAQYSQSNKVMSANEIPGAAPQEVEFPALEANSKEDLKWTVRVSAPSVRTVQPPYAPWTPTPQPHPWLASQFRVAIDGTDTSRVARVDSITVKAKGSAPVNPAMHVVGNKSNVAVSNLVLYLATGSEQAFRDWLAKTPRQLRNGSITLLQPNLQSPLATFNLKGLAITKLETNTGTGTASQAPKVRIEMTVESLQFSLLP